MWASPFGKALINLAGLWPSSGIVNYMTPERALQFLRVHTGQDFDSDVARWERYCLENDLLYARWPIICPENQGAFGFP